MLPSRVVGLEEVEGNQAVGKRVGLVKVEVCMMRDKGGGRFSNGGWLAGPETNISGMLLTWKGEC